MLAAVHEKLEDDLLNELRKKAAEKFELTIENRDEVTDRLGVILLNAVGGPKAG